ncbi:hypothetical protein O1611_g2553 [Lasiodiplodia mahajangana]|uniref:Uncharacterized protein n=1 Tax=Lasiodiplodia mahajangana TaxID=1108764 RepID=A0ACC2JUI6_9PEZI|nr:hypothetical protein O1611_g2553 [Lasiodiplodia mahajangana]
MPHSPVDKRSGSIRGSRAVTPSTTSGVQARRTSPRSQYHQEPASSQPQPRRGSLRIKIRQGPDDGDKEKPKAPQVQVQQNQNQESPPSLESQPRDCSPDIPDPKSSKYAEAVWVIYMGGELYSIYDRKTRRYIYHARRHAKRGYTVTYSDGKCTAIRNKAGTLLPVLSHSDYDDVDHCTIDADDGDEFTTWSEENYHYENASTKHDCEPWESDCPPMTSPLSNLLETVEISTPGNSPSVSEAHSLCTQSSPFTTKTTPEPKV